VARKRATYKKLICRGIACKQAPAAMTVDKLEPNRQNPA